MTTAKFRRSFLARNIWVNATRRYSQSEKDKEIIETCQNVKEAADAFKDGMKVVKKTSVFVKESAAATAESVNKMTEQVTDKAKDIVSDFVSDATKATKEAIKEKSKD